MYSSVPYANEEKKQLFFLIVLFIYCIYHYLSLAFILKSDSVALLLQICIPCRGDASFLTLTA